ncbi:hypothetical protein ACFE04_010625 [Oxalis oulophora]
MGDSETAVAGTYVPTGYVDPSSSVVTENVPAETTCSVTDSSGLGNVAYASNQAEGGETQAVVYNSSENGNVGSESGVALVQNGSAPSIATEATPVQQFVDSSVVSSEEDRLWSIVRANSLDFNAWTTLIEETEKVAEDNIEKIRKAYDAFLVEFPLCYGYWKKYADHEARLGNMDKVVEVYERAVLGVTYSVDIWLHYCIFAISTYGDPETVRRLFERGLAYVGSDYLSAPLWDKYIEYEYMQQSWGNIATIYTTILQNPNQQLDKYFTGFKELAASHHLSELRTAEESAQVTENEAQHDNAEESSEPLNAGLKEADELEKYMAIREEMYRKTKEFDSKIIGFEMAIRRPYFHVRPLNVAELENWHNYLDFIERDGDLNKVVKLYERCLIACANYPDYWIRYVLCMEASGSMDLAENALTRASQVFVKRQPEIHLFAARFREQNGDVPGARAAYQLVHSEVSPGLLEAIIKHANMERRMGKLQDAFALYEHAIAIEKGKEQSQSLPMLYAQYARFLYLVAGNAEKSREILAEALEHVELSKAFLEALIHFESIQTQSHPKRFDYLEPLVEKFIVPNSDSSNVATATDREELSSIFIEFLGLFGDVESIKKAENRHARLFFTHRSTSEIRKRHADEFLASEKAKMAKSYSSDPSATQAAYPNAQNQWAAAGYGVQPQAWPPVTQPQVAAYGAAYSGYPSSYTTPQAAVPASVPQTAAYGAYPPAAYPAQVAFPQQSYAQPAPAAAVAPAQQPAPVAPQPYYGTYYAG